MTVTQEARLRIFELIPKIMKDIGGVSKTRKNTQQNYSFRGIEDFYLAAQPALIRHGVFCAPKVLERLVDRFEKTNDQGRTTVWLHVALRVLHRFYASDASFIEVETWGEGLDNSDKATNKAMSGAMKYALIELFCVPTKDVEDADRDSPEAGIAPTKPARTRTFGDPPVSASVGGEGNSASNAPVAGGVRQDTLIRGAEPLPTPDSIPSSEEAFCTRVQQDWLRLQFEEALPPIYKKKADELRREWLATRGFKLANGTGTSTLIPRSMFKTEAKAAIKHAESIAARAMANGNTGPRT